MKIVANQTAGRDEPLLLNTAFQCLYTTQVSVDFLVEAQRRELASRRAGNMSLQRTLQEFQN